MCHLSLYIERGLECIVAPYEADAQMAWLNKKGLAEYIITEDSDLTLFGAHKILFKLDLQGNALLVENTKLHLAMGCKPEKYTFDKFRRMCILSGCDYLDSLPGIGLKKALKFILTTEEDDMKKALKKIPQYLKMKQLDVSDEYIDKFLKAEATFKYMYIYNPLERRMERLHDLDEFGTDEEYCSNAGTLLEDQEQALQLALGNLNPFTLEKLDDWHPDKIDWSNVSKKQKRSLKHVCIWGSTKCHSKKMESGEKSVGASLPFKKIEFKNMAEVEIQENLAEEKSKLEEAEIFSMYSYGQAHGKRKREPSDSEEGDETCVVEVPKTPSKTYNPFAINHNSSLDEKPKSPVCTSRSLLKLLSPHKNLEESTSTSRNIKESVDIKSRFFVQNVKQITKKPFAARDLSEEMTKLEEKSRNTSVIQKTLYYDLSPQSTKDEENNNKLITRNIEIFAEAPERNDNLKYENDLENTNNSIPHTASEEILEIVSDEDDNPEENVDEFPKFFQTSSQSLSSTQKHLGLSKPKKANSTSGKNSKSILNDSKQSTLSMFGFQKRPTLKKN